MTDGSLFRYYAATIASLWFVTVVTIVGELVPALNDFVGGVFSHHWLGKSVLTLVVFGLVVVAAPSRQFDERRWANYVLGSVVAGGVLVLGYFALHFLTT